MPLIYASNQELIDTQLKNASDLVNEQTTQLREAAGKHTSQVTDLTKQYMGDYSAKAQNMIRGRTASPEAKATPKFPEAPSHEPEKPLEETDFPDAPKGNVEQEKPEAEKADGAPVEDEPLI